MLIAVAKGTLIRGAIAGPRGPISARGDARAMRGPGNRNGCWTGAPQAVEGQRTRRRARAGLSVCRRTFAWFSGIASTAPTFLPENRGLHRADS